ncbi:unnamed protein product [Urochloa decumbens]|uniref:Uncharacterized protein n=1 Tax=Urochloa decumbens TaxID=240449 RepID=A0ABC8XW99_9POAL
MDLHTRNIDGAIVTRRHRRFYRRPTEHKNPGNTEFERQVAAIVARQKEQECEQWMQMFAYLGLPYYYYNGYGPPVIFIEEGSTSSPSEQKQQKQKSDGSDFLEGTFLKIGSDKQKATRNENNSKNKKKKKGKSRKQSHASEMQIKLHTEPSSTCVNASSSSEALPFSSSYVATEVPRLEYSSSSSSSTVTELISPVSSASSVNEKELSSSSNEFRSFSASYYSFSDSSVNNGSSTGSNASVNESYTDSNAWNNTMGDKASSLSDVRSEWSWSAKGLTDSRGFNKWGGDRNKPNDHKSFSVTINPSSSSQEGSLCSDDASHDGEFQKVISRKAAQNNMKKIRHLQSPTPSPTMPASVPISSALVPGAPHEITLGHYIKDVCFSGRKPNHKKGKYQKGLGFSSVRKTGFTDEENVGNSRMLLTTVNPGNLESSQMAMSSTSRHNVALDQVVEETCSSELKHAACTTELMEQEQGCLPLQGELNAFALEDGDAEDTDSIAAISDKTSSLDDPISYVDLEEQKKDENEQASCSNHKPELDKIIKAVKNAYEIQAGSDMYMSCGHPIASIETFLQSATPVIRKIARTRSKSGMHGQPVCNQPYRDQMPSVALRSVWNWYEEPGSFGIEVEIHRSIIRPSISGTFSRSEICAYFVPSLSAVQLFEQSSFSTSPNDGGLLFEYFERENPFLRPPLFTKIKQLVSGVNPSGNPIFGDPKQLESARLSDLHPASWFCVAWYPTCQIPSSAIGRCKSAFLTYHSLGKLVPQTYSTDMDDGLTPVVVCRIVGLLSYKVEGEKWFQLGEQPESKPTPGGSMEMDPAEILNKRMRTLKHTASAMSTALKPRAAGGMSYHPDYDFFGSQTL